VRARACANTCSTLLSRRPAGSKSHPRAESALHTRCRPLRSGGRAIGLKDTDTLCVRNIRDLSQKKVEFNNTGVSIEKTCVRLAHYSHGLYHRSQNTRADQRVSFVVVNSTYALLQCMPYPHQTHFASRWRVVGTH